MHDIEPYYKWRDRYCSEQDRISPFYGRVYSEFNYSQKIYNFYIHPQWDDFGSNTLYMKLIYVDYEENFACIELIGEWNDCLTNDIMYIKRNVADHLIHNNINKFILLCENVLNFHGSDDSYYEEWNDDIKEENGWICLINPLQHVQQEMESTNLHHYINMGEDFNDVNWRIENPLSLKIHIEKLLNNQIPQLSY